MSNMKFKEFGSLKTQLESKRCPDKETKNLYAHMGKVIDHIAEHCPLDALNKLEEISYLIKNEDKFKMEEFLKVNQSSLHSKPGEPTIKLATEDFIENSMKHFQVSSFFNFVYSYIIFRKNTFQKKRVTKTQKRIKRKKGQELQVFYPT